MIRLSLHEPMRGKDPVPEATVDAHIDSQRLSAGRIDHQLTLEAVRAGKSLWTKQISFKVDAPFDVPDLPVADPFLIAALFPAMEAGGTLRVHGNVSRVLLRNVLDYLSAWHLAGPHLFRPLALEVAGIDDEGPAGDQPSRALLAYSGGMDALLALCRNASGDTGVAGYTIGGAMMIHGMATGRAEGADPSAVISALRRSCARWDVPMAVVDTNITEVIRRHYASHGTWLASCLTLFSGRFDVGLVGSSTTFFSPGREVYGSHPLLDRLLSSGRMRIRNDEGYFKRVEKAALLARYPDSLADLRICFHHYRTGENCCRCEKCIRTMLCFVANGDPLPAAFKQGLDLDAIGIGMGRNEGLGWAAGIIRQAQRNGVDDHPAIQALRRQYRKKRFKVAAKMRLRRLLSGRRASRWEIFDMVGSGAARGPQSASGGTGTREA